MSWISALNPMNWGRKSQPEVSDESDPSNPMQLEKLRRWESAETTRLNQHQWTGVSGNPINFDLMQDWQTLVARCTYERMNNPLVEGVCDTFAIDVVGRRGPHLIVESDNKEFNDAAEKVWNDWFSKCCVDGTGGVDLLRRLVGQSFDKGDWLHQFVDMSDELPSTTPVKTRLLDIDPTRMWDSFTTSNKSIMGVERDKYGRPKRYWIRDEIKPNQINYNQSYEPIVADDILHCFQSREPGQVRGIPRLASVLQELADLRDYDAQVLDAARTAANNGMLLWTTEPTLIGEKGVVPATGSKLTLERQVAKYVTPGYQVSAQSSTQPGAHYIDFRHEKIRSLGRCAHMPLLMVLLSAEDSNFSQSRIDLNVIYQRGVNSFQNWIENVWLEPLRKMVFREAMLAFAPGQTADDADPFLLPRAPKKVNFRWGWEPIAQANPKDHVKVQTDRIAWGLSAPAIELANEGLDEDFVLASLARTNAKRKKMGLPPLPMATINGQQQQSGSEESNDDSNDSKASDKTNAKTKSKSRQPVQS